MLHRTAIVLAAITVASCAAMATQASARTRPAGIHAEHAPAVIVHKIRLRRGFVVDVTSPTTYDTSECVVERHRVHAPISSRWDLVEICAD
jgi:hypothetical protein